MEFDSFIRWLLYKRKREKILEEDLKKLDKYKNLTDIHILIQRINERRKKDSVRFIIFGDTRGDFRIGRDIILSARLHNPDFILMTGDIVRRGRIEEYLAHHLRMIKLAGDIPVIPVPGNHEEGPNGDYLAFLRLYGSDRFVFDCGPATFVGFNNNSLFSFTAEELNFLSSALENSASEFKFVVMHKPPNFLKVFSSEEEGRGVRWRTKKFHMLMVRHQVREVFMGHVHGFVTMLIDNVRYTVTAGGGARLEEMLSKEKRIHHYLLYEIVDGEIRRFRYEWQDGEWQKVLY
ncbi:MAG: metallophosphoesterase [Candidatus Hydrogenedentes bacterium]|nr:metallophosphoesterase [Candidatus Hydrogenedentota bacterium]